MHRINFAALFPLLIGIALVGYFLPWILTPASSLNLGGYDLAEWSSLHPIVRQTSPFLWTSLALRIPLAILGVLFAGYVSKYFHRTSIALGCLLIFAVSLLPPLEFFTVYRDDPNYRQQFILTLVTLVIGIPIVIWRFNKIQKFSLIAISILGALTSAVGLYQVQSLLQGFNLDPAIGSGGIITTIALVALSYITKQSS